MFCPNCGKNLPDNSAFCDGCGTRLGAAPAPVQPAAPVYAAPVAPAQPNPTLDNLIAAIKGFFSANPVNGIEKASKSTSLEWLILFGITAFFNMFYRALMPCHEDGDFMAIGLLGGLLYTAIMFFGLSVILLLVLKLTCNKDVAMSKIFNVTALAMLPLGISYLLNIIFGFVWDGMTATFTTVALIAFAMLLYAGIQKLGDNKASIWIVVILFAVILLVMYGWGALWLEITEEDFTAVAPSSFGGAAMNEIQDLMSSFGSMMGY